jgi:hypothetical protein
MKAGGGGVGTLLALTFSLGCATAFAEAPLGWYPLRGRELPWTLASCNKSNISVDESKLENGVWKIQLTLKDGDAGGEARGLLGVTYGHWEKPKLQLDLARTPVFSCRFRCTQRDARGVQWGVAPQLGILDESGTVTKIELDARTFRGQVGEWVTCTMDLSPSYLKFARKALVGIEWRIGCAANLAGDRALYLNSVRLPRYNIAFAKRWKADVTAAEALLARAEQAFAAGDYAAALDLQAQVETEAQRALAAQPDYAAVTPGLNEIKAGLGQMVTRIRNARVAGRVKDDNPIAKGQGLAGGFAFRGIRYNRDLLPVWVRGGSPQLRDDVEKLRKEVAELQTAMDRELGPAPQ